MHASPPERSRSVRSGRPSGRRRVRGRIGGVLGIAGALALTLGLLPGGEAASAAPPAGNGCGYGSGGPAADTLCWVDLSGYDDAAARSGAGQPLTATLPGGYLVDFTVRTSGDRGVTPVGFPSWDYGAAIGKYIYLGTPGQPALYQSVGAGAGSTTIALTDISVTDGDGNPVHGWRLVGADAEATADSESITFSSDAAVSILATYAPDGGFNGCQSNVSQVDANTIRCTGSGVGDRYGTVLVGATEPSSFTQLMTVGNGVSREAVAFAFQSSIISLNATVTGRANPADAFRVRVLSPEGTEIGLSGTAGGDLAGTGDIVVLPRVDGSAYTLRLDGDAGVDLSRYAISWTCTVDGATDPSLSAADVTAITVSPAAGAQVACTVAVTFVGGPSTSTSTSTTTTIAPVPPVATIPTGPGFIESTTSTTSTTVTPTTVESTTTTEAVEPATTTSTTEVAVDPGSTIPLPPIEQPRPPQPPVAPSTQATPGSAPQALARTGSGYELPLTLVGTTLLALGVGILRIGNRRRLPAR